MTLFVINPNSSETVTTGIEAAIAPLRGMGIGIDCLTLAEGPPGIESQAQADEVVPHLLALAARLENRASGFGEGEAVDPDAHAPQGG
ncbi:aspartate/glutamate racemase family protein, partial [Roseicyclus sp.]|uniref:aspartate/glutamate racemase family protein n=1 Tax=Roseicyclus sp. TaxID=1914329 RepID=UPI003FA055AB